MIKLKLKPLFITAALLINSLQGFCQDKKEVYVDGEGVIRWIDTKKEAAFFGVNYTAPFAYGYRALKALGIHPEEEIKQDVYHMSRLGIDAFRVHVWDTEITDSAGNLLNNEHLRLFDFLLAELKKRNIKTIVTPIAFWGNGYPERDEKTPGFSAKYGKDSSVVKEVAIKAQENYLKQFFSHVNPYTKLSYIQDQDIIATEINNEPHHSGPKALTKSYVNRLAAAIRNIGWKKPVFYNISESPWYADAVANANIDGVSFQWYPTGLVANQTLKGNFLPNVDKYHIPFDTIPAFKNKARMVYEFDAGDVLQPIMYPAMARSFRTAGFQWATQFAYDPMATAYANTEYQTHYLNLAYTPAKAISLLIASKVFHQVPRLKSYGVYPASSRFENFRISYKDALSEMNSEEEFYYSNNTTSKPVNAVKLKKLAGVGSSQIVTYSGKGAYFLDKVEDGVWRLEVMPDAIHIRDPFKRASLKKEVTRIEWRTQQMNVSLSNLGSDFTVKPLNNNNTFNTKVKGSAFDIYPGTYLLISKKKASKTISANSTLGAIALNEFVAPQPISTEVVLKHQPYSSISEGEPFSIKATIVGLKNGDKVTLNINQLDGEYKTIAMTALDAYVYEAKIPAAFVIPGLLNYKIVIRSGDNYHVFPGNFKENPFAWDSYTNETWKTYVASSKSKLELFNAGIDQNLRLFPNWNQDVKRNFITGESGTNLIYQVTTAKKTDEGVLGLTTFIADKISGRMPEVSTFKSINVRGRSVSATGGRLKVALIDTEGKAFSAWINLTSQLSDIEIPIAQLKPDSSVLLPRPYPGFQPLWFNNTSKQSLDLSSIEKLQISVNSELKDLEQYKLVGFELESLELKK